MSRPTDTDEEPGTSSSFFPPSNARTDLPAGGWHRTRARVWFDRLEYPRSKLWCHILPPHHDMSTDETQALLSNFWSTSKPCIDLEASNSQPTLSLFAMHKEKQDQAARALLMADDAVLFENSVTWSGDGTPETMASACSSSEHVSAATLPWDETFEAGETDDTASTAAASCTIFMLKLMTCGMLPWRTFRLQRARRPPHSNPRHCHPQVPRRDMRTHRPDPSALSPLGEPMLIQASPRE